MEAEKMPTKRGPYKHHTRRARHQFLDLFPNVKTSTPQGKREYQRLYMREYMRVRKGIPQFRFGHVGRPTKELQQEMERMRQEMTKKLPSLTEKIMGRKKRR